MGQEFQKIRARSLDEAYRIMRRRFGLDALVVSTKQITEGGLFGFFGQKMVEVTAAVPTPEVHPSGARRQSAIERRYAAQSIPEDARRDAPIDQFEQIIRDAQMRMRGEAPARPPIEAPAADASPPMQRSPESAATEPPRPSMPQPVRQEPVTPPRYGGALPGAAFTPAPVQAAEAPVVPFPKQQQEEPTAEALRREMREIRDMLQVLYTESPGAGLPTEFAPYYRMLVNRGVSRKIAAQLVAGVVKDVDLSVLQNPRVFEERLKLEIRKRVPVSGGIAVEAGSCRVVALCGPTGVGKTTNLAKLAAQFTVREHARVAMITADTYRIAAPEQLRVYANIIGVPMRVVNDPGEMAETLQALADYDLVFVDTAGNSQFNLEQINELKSLLQVASPHETILAMGANTQLEDLRSVASNFKCLNPTSLLFTKIDETRQYGVILSILAEAGLPLGYLSTGQNVPDDIRVASSAVVASLIMEGREYRG